MKKIIVCFLISIVFIVTIGHATHDGPELIRVVDGDTVVFDVLSMRVGNQIRSGAIYVRLTGVDTPELRGKCLEEKSLARSAKRFVYRKLSDAKKIELKNPSIGKYGRVVATLIVDGVDIANDIISAGLGRPYSGDKRKGWCTK